MKTVAEVGLTFLIVTNNWWGKGLDLKKLKAKAAREGTFTKGEKRQFFVYLVAEETEIALDVEDLKVGFVFPNELAQNTSLYLGEL